MDLTTYTASHFKWEVRGKVGVVTIDEPARKNPLTFDSYAELRDLFRALVYESEIKAIVITGADGNFCSGGDVHDIIGPLVRMTMPELLDFTRMTGDVVKAMRGCPQPVIAAIDGVCVGAGAILAMASDMRFGTAKASIAFLFSRVGLAGCDMGACAILPRIIGQGRAAELLYSGRAMDGAEAFANGFFNRVCAPDDLISEAVTYADKLANGPTFAHAMTKNQLNVEWDMSLDAAIEAEAQAQAICMQTRDFERAYSAFVAKSRPAFEGN